MQQSSGLYGRYNSTKNDFNLKDPMIEEIDPSLLEGLNVYEDDDEDINFD
jgi:hypothetical protein